MSFQTEIEKLARTRRAYLRFALEENAPDRLWSGNVDRRYGKVGDAQGQIPIVGTVSRFGTVQRGLANFLYAVEVPSISVELFDPHREWHALAGGFEDQLIYRNISFWIRVLDDLLVPFQERIIVAQIHKPSFPAGGKVTLDCQVSSGTFLGSKVPRRFITTTDFPNAPAEVQGLPVPIIYGVRHNNVVPFVLPPPEEPPTPTTDPLPGGSPSDDPATLPPLDGTETINCGDLWSDDFEGSLSGYTSGAGNFTLASGAGAGGSKALRPVTSPDSTLVKTVTPPRRGFCVEWSTDSDQTTLAAQDDVTVDGVGVYRISDADIWIEVPQAGTLAKLVGVVTPGTMQTFKLEGAFASQNFTVTLTAALNLTDTSIHVSPADAARLQTSMTLKIGSELVRVTSINPVTGVIAVTRAVDGSVKGSAPSGTVATTGDINGYLKFSIDGVVKYSIFNTALIRSASSTGLWTTVALTPGGDADNFHIGSGLIYTEATVPTEPPAPKPTDPYGGSPLNPVPTPDCQAATAGGGSPSGGAVRAMLVGRYVTGTAEPAPPVVTFPPPSPTISVVGPGGTGEYQYVVTAVYNVAGAADPLDFAGRTNHTGESGPSAVLHITNGPTHDADFGPSNYVKIEWPRLPNVKFYRVYGRYMTRAPFSWLDTQSGYTNGTGFYQDGFLHGHRDFDILKTDTHPPAGTTGGGGGGVSADNMYVLAGHALKNVTDVYVLKPVIMQSFAPETDPTTGETTTQDPVRSEPVQLRQTEVVDYTQRWIDVNGHRYHVLLFKAAQVSETCEYYEVTANVEGIETNADGSGTLITNADEMFEHAMLNWILNSYQSSAGQYAPPGGPWFTDVPYAPGIWDHNSVLAAKAVGEKRLFGGYVGSGVLDEVIEAREWIREMLISFDLELYFNNNIGASGAWSISRFDPTVDRASLPHWDAGVDAIFQDSFETTVDVEAMINVLPFFAGPTTERTGKNDPATFTQGGGWKVSGEARSNASITRFGMAISDPMYLKWTEDLDTASDVLVHYLAYMELPPVTATFRMGLRALTSPLSSLIRVTHPDGVGTSTGWTEHVCKVLRSDIDLDRLSAAVTVVDVDRLMTS